MWREVWWRQVATHQAVQDNRLRHDHPSPRTVRVAAHLRRACLPASANPFRRAPTMVSSDEESSLPGLTQDLGPPPLVVLPWTLPTLDPIDVTINVPAVVSQAYQRFADLDQVPDDDLEFPAIFAWYSRVLATSRSLEDGVATADDHAYYAAVQAIAVTLAPDPFAATLLDWLRLHHYSKVFTTTPVLSKLTLAMREALARYHHDTRVLVKAFVRWGQVHQSQELLAQLLSGWELQLQRMHFVRWFETFQKTRALQHEASSVHRSMLQYRFLRHWQCQTLAHHQDAMLAELWHDKRITRRAWTAMALPAAAQPLRQLVDRVYLGAALRCWRNRMQPQPAVSLQAPVARFFLLWRAQTSPAYQHQHQLEQMARGLVLRRAFSTWHHQTRLRTQLHAARGACRQLLAKWCFDRWAARTSEHAALAEHTRLWDRLRALTIFTQWYHESVLLQRARSIHQQHTLAAVLTQWRLRARASMAGEIHSGTVLQSYFRHWVLASREREWRAETTVQRVALVWDRWRLALQRSRLPAIHPALLAIDNRAGVAAGWKAWRESVARQQLMEAMARGMCLRRAMTAWQQRLQQRQRLVAKAKALCSTSKTALKVCFRRWVQQHEQVRLQRLETVAAEFAHTRHNAVLWEHVAIWRTRTREVQRRVHQLEQQLLEFMPLVVRTAFNRWQSRMELLRSHTEEATAYHNTTAVAACWHSWRQQMTRLDALVEVLEEHALEQDYAVLKRMLARWSLQSLRNRRNAESARMVRLRREHALLRQAWLVWRESLAAPTAGADDSFLSASDPLPLASRRRLASPTLRARVPGVALPLRYSAVMLTPRLHRSPQKFLETSERIRTAQRQAARERWSRAVRGPRPLPPPPFEEIVPPSGQSGSPTPGARSTTPGARSTTPNAPPASITYPVRDEDELLTAKRNRRITPIHINPTGIELPKISPAPVIRARSRPASIYYPNDLL